MVANPVQKYDPEEMAKAHDRRSDPERWKEEIRQVEGLMVWFERYIDALLAVGEKQKESRGNG